MGFIWIINNFTRTWFIYGLKFIKYDFVKPLW